MSRLSTILIRAGYPPTLAEELDDALGRFGDGDLRQARAWSLDALGRMSYADYVREARIGWWASEGVPFDFKRLLDSKDEIAAGKALVVEGALVAADARHAALSALDGPLLGVLDAAARRAWADAYRDWERAPYNPDAPPELPPDLAGGKALVDFYALFQPGDFDPAHPAHALRLHMEAARAWAAENHPRHPVGTPVDPDTGAGGGRFAPKNKSGEISAQSGRRLGVFDPRPDDVFQRAVDRDAQWFASLRNEELRIYDEQGEIAYSLVGTHDGVGTTQDLAQIMQEMAGRGWAHNHPVSFGSFSTADITMSIVGKSAQAVAVGGDFVYRLDLPPEFHERMAADWGLSGPMWDAQSDEWKWQRVAAYVNSINDGLEAEMKAVFQPMISGGEISVEQSNAAHLDLLFSSWKGWFAERGATLSRLERVDGFFVKPDTVDLPILQEARELATQNAALTFFNNDSDLRTDYAVLYGEGSSRALVAASIHKPVPYSGRLVTGADALGDLVDVFGNGVREVYFAGISHAYRLRVSDLGKLLSRALRQEYAAIKQSVAAGQERNEMQALAKYAPYELHTRASDPVATAAITNHLAWLELARRHPDVFSYRALFYPGKNVKTVDPADPQAIRDAIL